MNRLRVLLSRLFKSPMPQPDHEYDSCGIPRLICQSILTQPQGSFGGRRSICSMGLQDSVGPPLITKTADGADSALTAEERQSTGIALLLKIRKEGGVVSTGIRPTDESINVGSAKNDDPVPLSVIGT